MADVFVSYSREDRDWVQLLVEALELAGFSVWWDFENRPGRQFDQQIEAELKAAKAVVVVWSTASIESDWVKAEAGDGLGRGILVPVLKDRVTPPLPFRQLHTADLSGWTGGEHPELTSVIRALRTLVDGAPKPGTPIRPIPVVRRTSGAVAELKRSLAGHRYAIGFLEFSHDGTRLISGSSDSARVWDTTSGKLIRRIEIWTGYTVEGAEEALAPQLSPDGAGLLTAARNGVLLSNAVSGRRVSKLRNRKTVRVAKYNTNGSHIVTAPAESRVCYVWQAATGKHLATLSLSLFETLVDAALSGYGTTAVLASSSEVAVYDMVRGARRIGKFGAVSAKGVAVSPDGTRVLVSGYQTEMWMPANSTKIAVLSNSGNVSFSRRGDRALVWSAYGGVHLLDAASGAAFGFFPISTVSSAAFSPTGTRVVIGATNYSDKEQKCLLVDTTTGRVLSSPRHEHGVESVRFNASGTRFVTASRDGSARVWQSSNGAPVAQMVHENGVRVAAVSADGAWVATAEQDATAARLWRVTSA